MKSNTLLLAAVAGVAGAFDCTPAAFADVLGPNGTVTSAQSIPAYGTFYVPATDYAYPESPSNLPALCAIEVSMYEIPNAPYTFGMFLPDSWNGRFLAVGNAGLAGGINWVDVGTGSGYGFATVSSGLGHVSVADDGSWANQDPEQVINWGYRALHGSVVMAKEITQAYYSGKIAYSYYSGCSTGGRQGLKEAEMFPEDFDGILAGAPSWDSARVQLWDVQVAIFNLPVGAPNNIPTSLFANIGGEVLRQCDPQDGLTDTIISDPAHCDFDYSKLLCGPDVTDPVASACLTSAQNQTLSNLYHNWVEGGQTIFPGLELGSEAQWYTLVGAEPVPDTLGTSYVEYFLGLGPNWDYETLNLSTVELSVQLNPGNASADNFDLSPFYHNGGKLLHYHGFADGSIPTGSSINFYDQVNQTLHPQGIDLDNFYRFFLVPGMQHCVGTPADVNAPWYFAGPNQAGILGGHFHSTPGFSDARHDILLGLMAWVETGTAPTDFIATKWNDDGAQDYVYRQRPICMYPSRAVYSGSGDVDEASNWACSGSYL